MDTYSLCQKGHVWLWSGGGEFEVPEGYVCSCGKTKAHYETCPECNSRRLVAIPIDNIIGFLSSDDDTTNKVGQMTNIIGEL